MSNTSQEKIERALQIIRFKGPLVPLQVAKDMGIDTLMAGAIISTLVSKGVVKVSHAKLGSSPLYYVPGQEHKLVTLYEKLPEKEREAFVLLKEKKSLYDADLKPVIRVALREIKDFAIPLKVVVDSDVFLFWKWYLSSDEEVEPLIQSFLKNLSLSEEKTKETIQEGTEKEFQREQKEIIGEKEEKIVTEQKTEIQPTKEIEEPLKTSPLKKESLKKEKGIDFHQLLQEYFSTNKIILNSRQEIKKNKEFDFIVEIPSKIGSLTFYAKALNKKKISDVDILLAYTHAQEKKMPLLFLSHGEPTKKAHIILENNFKGRITFRSL